MTRKDYILLAEKLNDCFREHVMNSPENDTGFKEAVLAVGSALKRDNPRFDEIKFLEACIK